MSSEAFKKSVEAFKISKNVKAFKRSNIQNFDTLKNILKFTTTLLNTFEFIKYLQLCTNA